MKTIETIMLDTIQGGAFVGLTAGTPTRGTSSTQLQTALAGVTTALDSLKASQNTGGINQLLPVAIMAKWMQNR